MMSRDLGPSLAEVTSLTESCGISHPVPLADIDLLEPPSGLIGAPLAHAHDDARSEASEALEIVLEYGLARFPLPNQADITQMVVEAAALADSSLLGYVQSRTGEPGQMLTSVAGMSPFNSSPRNDPNGFNIRAAVTQGALTLANVERRSRRIRQLCELVSRSFDTTVTATAMSGEFHDVAAAAPRRRLVIALQGDLEVSETKLGTSVIAGSQMRIVDELASVRTLPGDFGLVIDIPVPTRDFLIAVAIRKAGYFPRLRGDMPFEIDRPVTGHGLDGQTDVANILNQQAAQLFDDMTMTQAVSWWRGNALPVVRPQPWIVDLPADPSRWPRVSFRGALPAGFQALKHAPPGFIRLAAASHWFDCPDHLGQLMETLVRGDTLYIDPDGSSDCPNGDPYCVHRSVEALALLGLVDLTIEG